jgi:VWFA-related protein
MNTRSALAALATVASTAALSGALLATNPQDRQQRPVFRTTTELIEIDVVVVDKNGEPVHGLTREDFLLRDRKQPQAIETFTEVQRAIERAEELPPLPAETRVDVATNTSAKAGRLVVMVLDDLHVFRGRTETVKDIASQIVSDLGPESSMALIQTGGDHGVEVTDDRLRLLLAIEKFQGRRPTRRPLEACDPVGSFNDPETISADTVSGGCDIQEVNANRGLYRALEDAARILGSGDKRRKAFILVSENTAKDISGLFDGGTQVPDIVDSGGYFSGNLEQQPKAAPASDYQLLNTMNAMRRGNVATYSIDPRGKIGPQELMLECFPPPAGARGIGPDPCVGDEERGSPSKWNAWVRKAQQGLEIFSKETGGFAVVDTDDFTSGISRIISDLDNYYLLGFYPEALKSKGYRTIDVEVRGRPELTLRYRRGYQIEGPPDPPKATNELARLVGGALPKNDLPLRLHAIPMPPASGSGKNAPVVVALEISVPTESMKDGNSDRLLDDIQYGIYAIDLKGAKVREHQGSGAKVALRPRPGLVALPDRVTYEIVSEMQLAPGQYQLRASATSDRLAAGGSVYLSFEVPDFSKADLLLTDLVLAYADVPHVPIARDKAALPPGRSEAVGRFVSPAGRSIASPQTPAPPAPPETLPFDPTLDRVFASSDTLRLFFKAVQRGSATLTATISALAPDGAVIVTFDRPLGGGNQPSLDIQLPLSQLDAGPYRLQVTVTNGRQVATREVGFIVKP